MTGKVFPTIHAVEWIPASKELGGEASDFTPWLQQPHILEILGRTLKLEDLSALATEHNVLGKRLDILATATDEAGDEVPVCIENQYGQSDASHLGRLITYLAQHERGRAVWIVESAHEAYIAAVRFLNRTSIDDVGYYLVRVLLTHGTEATYQVHFEVLAAPLAWERRGKSGTGGNKPINSTKVSFLGEVSDVAARPLSELGLSMRRPHARGAYTRLDWPRKLWFEPYSIGLDIRVTRRQAVVAVYVTSFGDNEQNERAASVLRDHVEDRLSMALPPGSSIDWDVTTRGLRKPIVVRLEGGGFLDGEPATTGLWVVEVCRAWIGALQGVTTDPLASLTLDDPTDIDEEAFE
jgi:hypothetical protein